MGNPKLSIITINLNNKEGLQKTIKSVISQTFIDYEYIIIDGLSTDGSVEVIEEYSNNIRYWVSEPDKGIYNAMNKGIKQAQGDYILLLNSGDYLIDETIVKKAVDFGLDSDIVYGNILWEENNSTYCTTFPEKLRFSYFWTDTLGHSTTFIKRELHTNIGLYLETKKIVSDWCFFIQAICQYNCSYKHIPITIACCNRDGISCKPENGTLIFEERIAFLKQEFPLYINDYEEIDQIKKEIADLRLSNENNNRTINIFKKTIKHILGIASIIKKVK